MLVRCLALCLTLTLFTLSHPAMAFELGIPVKCEMGKDCFIQNYVDQGEGEARQDFRCRPLTYDKHKGTDFRIPVMPANGRTPPVLAAARGTVKRLRDGEPDRLFSKDNAQAVTGKECGNGIVIAHQGGWETQYCHFRRGSVRVKEGQRVEAGDMLGRIGLSGKTEFPHVQLSVRNPQGEPIDPFNARPMETGCEPPEDQLWSRQARRQIDISATGLLEAGIADRAPSLEPVILGRHQGKQLAPDAPALVIWALLYGVQEGDTLSMLALDPKDDTFMEHTEIMPASKVQYFQFFGKRRKKQERWATGSYEGLISLKRGEQVIADHSFTFAVEK